MLGFTEPDRLTALNKRGFSAMANWSGIKEAAAKLVLNNIPVVEL